MATDAKIRIKAEDKTKRAFKSFRSSMQRANKSISGMNASLGALVGVGGLGLLAKTSISAGDKIGKLSERLGASTEALSQYRHVAELSGVSFETLTMAWQRMTRRVAEAAQGTGEAKGALKELNLSAVDLNQLAPEKQFEALADAISKVKNPADRVRLSMKLFDSEGVSLIQTMKGGAAGMREMREEADRLGMTISAADAESFAKMNDTMTRIQSSMKGAAQSMTLAFGDDFADMVSYISGTAIPAFRLLAERVGLVDVNLKNLSVDEVSVRMQALKEKITDINIEIAKIKKRNIGEQGVLPGLQLELESYLSQAKKLGDRITELRTPPKGSNTEGDNSLVQQKERENQMLSQFRQQNENDAQIGRDQELVAQKDLESKKQQAMSETFATLSVLTASSSKRMFKIGKAAAIVSAIINTHQAITKTMAETPYPWNIPLATAQAAAGIVQVQAIKSQQFSGAREHGGTVMPTNRYLVAEKGKDEIFTPNVPGSVLPLDKIGGRGDVNISMQLYQTDGEDPREFGEKVVGVMKRYFHENMIPI